MHACTDEVKFGIEESTKVEKHEGRFLHAIVSSVRAKTLKIALPNAHDMRTRNRYQILKPENWYQNLVCVSRNLCQFFLIPEKTGTRLHDTH